jgi:nitrogen fixation protein NifU and related proteins
MSGLSDLYREVVLDHFRNPRGKGTLHEPPAVKAEGYNPYCGDEVTVYLEKADDGSLRIAWEGVGCSISQSSASMMAKGIAGKSPEEAAELVQRFREMLQVHEIRLGDRPSAAAAEAPTSSAPDRETQKRLGDLMALEGVVKLPVRLKCALLAWTTLEEAQSRLSGDQPA